MTARILDVTPDEYHRLPGFSSSLAKTLIARSPAHAWDAQQRQIEEQAAAEIESGDDEPEVSAEKQKRLDRGSVLHALVLGVGKRIEVIPASVLSKNGAYGTAESKALRDGARAAGRIPVKEPEMEIYRRIADIISGRIRGAGHVLDGVSELAIAWTERTEHGDVDCRAMIDHVVLVGDPPTAAFVYDLKIPGDASPDRCERSAESLGLAVQAVVYPRALNALYPTLAGRIEFRFLFCEPARPYEIWDPTPTGMFRELGESRWRRALMAWARGLATGEWPGYRGWYRHEIDAPLWVLKREGFTADE